MAENIVKKMGIYLASIDDTLSAPDWAFTAEADGFCQIILTTSGGEGKCYCSDTTARFICWAGTAPNNWGLMSLFPIIKGHSYSVTDFQGLNSIGRRIFYFK